MSKSTVLLEHHLKQLKLPSMLREYAKMAQVCRTDRKDYQTYLLGLCERIQPFKDYFTNTFGQRMQDRAYAGILARQIRDEDQPIPFFNKPLKGIAQAELVSCAADTTIREASNLGFQVAALSDCCAPRPIADQGWGAVDIEEVRAVFFSTWKKAFARVMTAAEALKELEAWLYPDSHNRAATADRHCSGNDRHSGSLDAANANAGHDGDAARDDHPDAGQQQ